MKKKLTLGLGFLFLIIFVLTIFCSYAIGKLSQEAGAILKDNYNSLVYSKNMTSSLEEMRTAISNIILNRPANQGTSDYFWQLFEKNKTEFAKNLSAESENITEIRESGHAQAIEKDFSILLRLCQQVKAGAGSIAIYFNEFQPAFKQLERSIDSIHEINMQAVVRKSRKTGEDAERTVDYMAGIGVFCLILAFAYFWYFPLYISNSLAYLADKMKHLLEKMGMTLDSKTDDELYVILQAINLIENRSSEQKRLDHPA